MSSDVRAERLRKVFIKSLHEEQKVSSPLAQLILEAIRTQPVHSSCVERIISSKHGLQTFGKAIRAGDTRDFIVSHVLPTLQYLSHPDIKDVADGQLLKKVLQTIIDPPTVWIAVLKLVQKRQVPDDQLAAFAWLACELISLSNPEVDVSQDVQQLLETEVFAKAQNADVREIGYKIEKRLQILRSPQQTIQADGPGGRHDNDHEDFRQIRIFPTADEFVSSQPPFYLTASDVQNTKSEDRARTHLDNQFRLLREDMLAELREDHQVAIGVKKGKRITVALGGFVPAGLDFGDEDSGRYKKCTMLLRCYAGLQFLQKFDEAGRKRYLKDNPRFLSHQSFGVLCRGKEIFGFAFVDRDIDQLVQTPPILSLQFTDTHNFRTALMALSVPESHNVQFILVNTAVFAYEPVLDGMQKLRDLPLQDQLVNPTLINSSQTQLSLNPTLRAKIEDLRKHLDSAMSSDGSVELPSTDGSKIQLDKSQFSALIHALANPLSLIQGPPGTGKSFVGAQIAKIFWKEKLRILVISYTNHALNQFLEDLIEAGIPGDCIVRMGAKSKCSEKTQALHISERKDSYRRSRDTWMIIESLKREALDAAGQVKKAYGEYRHFSSKCRHARSFSAPWEEISGLLEFFEDQDFYNALRVPDDNTGWQHAGKGGRKIAADYLYERWLKGTNPGIFTNSIPSECKAIWSMGPDERKSHVQRWTAMLLDERFATLQKWVGQYNESQHEIDVQFGDADAHKLQQKSIIGCTTTGAAKQSRLIHAAKPDVIIVEEAGEILESHVLTALAPTVKQLVLIGDHKQLRPKVNNFTLTVEKGDGFDLNRSLFERLIIQGASHKTLSKQHRMVPEISKFPRQLTYPDLVDGPNTSGRERIRGLRDRVVFLNHGKQEASDKDIRDRRDPTVKESKRNPFEAEMVLNCVKYLGQQGYATTQIVVLTPYLGQLRTIQDLLRDNNLYADLSDMDQAELVRAGLISKAAADLGKQPLRISTIDNYQGEESDIVIASLTRSNESGDIGFMSAPERLNVLITRARNCLILVGNMETFVRSKKGSPAWLPFFELLKTHGHLYDGLPVKCERHPERTADLKEPKDFLKLSPDGGCTQPCEAMLSCGIHKCKLRCHRITDHSKTQCHQLVSRSCVRQHKTKVVCSRRADHCQRCIVEDKETERLIKRDLKLEEARLQKQEAYSKSLQEIDAEIAHEKRIAGYKREEEEQKKTLEQRKQDLAALKDAQKRADEQKKQKEMLATKAAAREQAKAAQQAQKRVVGDSSDNSPDVGFEYPEDARAEWEHLKRCEGANSKAVDELMAMIGLEDVKQEFLSTKSKVDLALRQGSSLGSDRFSCSMLGNPGTGKTTVARLYAQFLTEVGVIPGTHFEETTGAAVANVGVAGCKKLVDGILNDGGGVLFIDEAYQLTSGNNPGGRAVLDYLLAEVENLRGKVVFVLAGYNKQMESFFAHNPGLPSRFPIEMSFADYNDDELLRILELKVNKRYNGLMDCEDGLRGLYCRIVARRVGYGRGKEGFGNARTVENTLSQIYKRQADRIRRERRAGTAPDDMYLTKEDLIGPEPSEALASCAAWNKLNNELTGLSAVKDAVKALVDSIRENYQRELAEQPPIMYSLNKVFLGNPGTGKTTVAKLYGEILASLGLLSKGEVVVKNPSDFVGSVLGQSEQNTKGILASALGKVLVIDEAYGLYGGGDNQGSSSDPYKTAVIDTIVAEVQSVPGDDRCVLLLGYKDQMENMFQNVNPGLSRRFPIASAFNFEDFSQDELAVIFDLKLKSQGYRVTEQAKRVAMEMLDRARNRPNFGNGGEIDIILDAAKSRHQQRLSRQGRGNNAGKSDLFEAEDFDPDFNRAERSESSVRDLFKDTVGSEGVVSLLEGYQETVRTLKTLDMNPKENIPFNFLFRGPPGTGKTTTAKKMGKVFYDMGFLATAEVVECSATDLIGQYVGQTGPKVQKLLDKALGRVLFVDEAYRLAEGHFAKEAMDELVDSVTKDRYHKKLIIILAGYDADINRLMSVNAGLTSRFPAVVDFRALAPEECISLLLRLLRAKRDELRSKKKDLDLSILERPSPVFHDDLAAIFAKLSSQDGWASARDVQSLARSIFNALLSTFKADLAQGVLILTKDIVVRELEAMSREREARSGSVHCNPATTSQGPLQRAPTPTLGPMPPPNRTTQAVATAAKSQTQDPVVPEDDPSPAMPPPQEEIETRADNFDHSHDHLRDPGVSDAIWEQLQRDRMAEKAAEEEYQKLKDAVDKAREAAREAARDKMVRKLVGEEQKRREEEEEKERKRKEEEEKLIKRLLKEEENRKKEAERKKKLEHLGRCPVGYAWVKQAGGYRCTAGGHWVSNAEVEKL